jgi:glutamate racemase
MMHNGPIGIFDSGVGGLSVLRHVQVQLPQEHILYLADQAHVPYGPRTAAEVSAFAHAITRFFLEQGSKLIVVACNTATAAALDDLRAAFPRVAFVGMEPAVKPGAAFTHSGKVGVLATAGTFVSQRYASLMARYARNVRLYENPCTGLVGLIEAGEAASAQAEQLLRECMDPMLAAGVDTIVLGCTHYPFVLPTVRAIAGPGVRIIDPAPAVARQVRRVLWKEQLATRREQAGQVRAFTTGVEDQFAGLAASLLGYPLPTQALHWQEGRLLSAPPSRP